MERELSDEWEYVQHKLSLYVRSLMSRFGGRPQIEDIEDVMQGLFAIPCVARRCRNGVTPALWILELGSVRFANSFKAIVQREVRNYVKRRTLQKKSECRMVAEEFIVDSPKPNNVDALGDCDEDRATEFVRLIHKRRRRIAEMWARGYPCDEIARRAGVSRRTVTAELSNLRRMARQQELHRWIGYRASRRRRDRPG